MRGECVEEKHSTKTERLTKLLINSVEIQRIQITIQHMYICTQLVYNKYIIV